MRLILGECEEPSHSEDALSRSTKNNGLRFDRLIPTVLWLVLVAGASGLGQAQDEIVRFRWEDRSSHEEVESRRVLLGSQGPIHIQVKPRHKDPIEIDFDLKPHLKSNLVRNLFLLFTQSEFFSARDGSAGQQEDRREGDKTTLQVDYENRNVTGQTRTVGLDTARDANLQTINTFFRNLCRQEMTLLELKTAPRQDQLGMLKKLDRNLRSGSVPMLDRFIPLLEGISEDQAATGPARNEARRIGQAIHSLMTAIGEPRKAGPDRATQSQQRARSSSEQPVIPSSEEGTLRVYVELVELDVIVTDRKGRHVTDLRKEDFEVLQDGNRQEIQAVSYVEAQPTNGDQVRNGKAVQGPAKSMETASASNHGLQRRAIAVVVDELGLALASINRSKKALRRFINRQIQPNDLVALVRTGVETEQISFTSDKTQLLESLDKVKYNPRNRLSLNTPPGVTPQLQKSREARERLLTLDTLETLWNTVSSMRRLPWRRSLILVSDGFRIDYGEQSGDPETEVDIASRIQKASRLLTDECHRASLVVYSIDARGLDSLSFGAEHMFPHQASRRQFFQQRGGLHLLAADTGGMFFKDNNDLSLATQRILRDQQGYYLVAYTPAQSGPRVNDGRFDKIKVKVQRRGVRVRSRSAAFGK